MSTSAPEGWRLSQEDFLRHLQSVIAKKRRRRSQQCHGSPWVSSKARPWKSFLVVAVTDPQPLSVWPWDYSCYRLPKDPRFRMSTCATVTPAVERMYPVQVRCPSTTQELVVLVIRKSTSRPWQALAAHFLVLALTHRDLFLGCEVPFNGVCVQDLFEASMLLSTIKQALADL